MEILTKNSAALPEPASVRPHGHCRGWPDEGLDAAGRRYAGVLVWLYHVTLVLASFYPYQPHFDQAYLVRQWGCFRHSLAMYDRKLIHERWGHFFLNIAFYLPLGMLVALSRQPRVRADSLRGGIFWRLAPAWGLLLSLMIECCQIGFDNRDPDLCDALMNTIGYLGGFMGVVLLSGRRQLQPALLLTFCGPRRSIAMLRWLALLYGLFILIVTHDPWSSRLGFSFTLNALTGRFAANTVIDLNLIAPWTAARGIGVVAVGVLFVPFGLLFRLAQARWNLHRLLAGLLLGVASATLLEVVNVAQPRRPGDLAQILGALLGLLAGTGLAQRYLDH